MNLKSLFLKIQIFISILTFSAFAFANGQDENEQLRTKLYVALLKDQADQVLRTPKDMIANLDRRTVLIPEEIRSLNLIRQSGAEKILTHATHPNFFEMIESEIIIPICRTKTGSKLCRNLYDYRKDAAQDENLNYADNWFNTSRFFNRLRIVLSEDPVQFSGFTVQFNPWLFLDLKQLNRAQFIRLVVHEMFQVLDVKNQIHLSPAIRADLLGDQIQCQEFDFLLDHRLRLALSHVRAVRVEDLVLREMGYQFQKKNYDKLTCERMISDDFKSINLSLTLVNKLYYHEANLFHSSHNSCPAKNQFSGYLEMPRAVLENAVEQERISKLDRTEVRDESYDRAETLCQFLIRPDLSARRLWLSQFLTASIFHGPKINLFDLNSSSSNSPLRDPTKPGELGPKPTEPGGPIGPRPNGPRPVGD